MSRVTELPAAEPIDARAHFEALLTFETDCWDVHASLDGDAQDFVLLDVRAPQSFEAGHVPGAISLPHGKINERNLAAYPTDTLFVVYCNGPHCNGADRAAACLARIGRRVKKMIGGIEGWKGEGFTLTQGVASLTASVALTTAEAAAFQSTQAIHRLQVVPGLQRPQADGRDLFSHVVVTSRRRTLYISGQLARDAQGKIVGTGDMRAQMRQVGENIKAALAAGGGTLADVVQTSTFVTDWSEFWKAIDIRHEYFGASLPTSTTVQVSALAAPEFMVEISAIAVLD